MAISSSKVAVWNRALIRIGENDLIETEEEDRPAAEVCRLVYDDIVREVLETRHWPWALRQRPISNIDEQIITADGDGLQTVHAIAFAFLDSSQVEVVQIDGSTETALDADDDYSVTPAVDGNDAYITLDAAVPIGQSLRITVTTSRSGWLHVFPLPSDCVTPVALLHQNTRYALTPAALRNEYDIVLDDAGEGQLLCANVDASDIDGLQYVAAVEIVSAMPRHFVNALAWRLAAELADPLKKDTQKAEACFKSYTLALSAASAQGQNLEQQSAEVKTPSITARG